MSESFDQILLLALLFNIYIKVIALYYLHQRELSLWLWNKLDEFGYSNILIKMRIYDFEHDISTTWCRNLFKSEDNCSPIPVGSRLEGIVLGLESDFDLLVVDNDVICINHMDSVTDTSDYKRVLNLDMTDAPPGYCYLKSLTGDIFREVLPSWVGDDAPRNGPAFQPVNFFKDLEGFYSFLRYYFKIPDTLLPMSFDCVPAYTCFIPGLLKAWCGRERKYDWPSVETIQHVSLLPTHVVKAALKGHEKEDIQWRFSFSPAEVHLIQTFNNTHIKVYVCLKKIAKQYLKPSCKDISSYVIKNIILWMAELQPTENFKPELLIERIKDGFQFLKSSVEKKHLKNYMIPEKNLFLNKLESEDEVTVVLGKLKVILKELDIDAHAFENFININNDLNKINRVTDKLLCLLSKDFDRHFPEEYYSGIISAIFGMRSTVVLIWRTLHNYITFTGIHNPLSIKIIEDGSQPSNYRLIYEDKLEHYCFYMKCLDWVIFLFFSSIFFLINILFFVL